MVAFDVIETLFSLAPLQERLAAAGLPAEALEIWFPRLLRDAFALETAGVFKTFREIAGATLAGLMAERQIEPSQKKVDQVLDGFAELPVHPDVQPAFEMLQAAGVRLVTLTNGSADTTRKLLQRSGLLSMIEHTISIEAIRRWKPAREVYLHAAKIAGVPPGDIALVAAHDWDTQGAGRAGLMTGWVGRKGKFFSAVMKPPDVRGSTLVEVAGQWIKLTKNGKNYRYEPDHRN